MKKLLLTSLVAVFTVSGAHAADYFVGGSVGLKFDDVHENYMNVAPEIGWNYNEKWDFGVMADLGYMRDATDGLYQYGVGGFARYHLAEIGGVKLMLKGTIGVGFDTISSDIDAIDGETTVALGASVIPMITYDVSEQFTLYANLNFLGVRAEYAFENETLGVKDGWSLAAAADSANVAESSSFQVGFLYNF